MATQGFENFTQTDVDRQNRKLQGSKVSAEYPNKADGVPTQAAHEAHPSSPEKNKGHKYRAEPCIVTADSIFSKEDIRALYLALRHQHPSESWLRLPLKKQAESVDVIGDWFGSLKEGRRWIELKQLEADGHIRELRRQEPYELCANGITLGEWRADFVFDEYQRKLAVWIPHVEDCKGMKTALYRWKKKHVESQYGISITET